MPHEAAAGRGGSASDNSGVAIAMMLAGVSLFAANDVLGKWLVGTYAPAQLILLRSLAALAVLLPLMGARELGQALRVRPRRLHWTRAVLSAAEVICFYLGVMVLPLADVMAYYLAAPIVVAALSPFLLGEHVGWRRWTAIMVGFAGVLIILSPSGSTNVFGAAISLSGTVIFSLLIVTTRLAGGAPDRTLVLWQLIGAFLIGAAATPFLWVTPTALDGSLMALLGVVSMGAYFCVNRALKLAPAATVTPYQYTLIVWALISGYFVFGDTPSPNMLLGAAIIIGAGLFIFWREQVAKAGNRQ